MSVLHASTGKLRRWLPTAFMAAALAIAGAARAQDALAAAGEPVMLGAVFGASAVCDNGIVFVRNSADGRPDGFFSIPKDHFLSGGGGLQHLLVRGILSRDSRP